MAATLTDKTVPALKPDESKPYEVRDKGGKSSVKGLLVRVQPSGTKTFYIELARGKRERVGDASLHTLTWARNKARRIAGEHADGHDFQAARATKKAAKQSTLIAYLDGDFKVHADDNIATATKFIASIKNAFDHVLNKPMADITELDMAKWNRKRTGVSIETRRRELTNLKALLNHAVRTKVIPSHQLTTYRLKGALTDKQSVAAVRYLTEDEEARLRGALDDREQGMRGARENYRKWQIDRGQALLAAIPDGEYADYLKPMVLIALNTGLRRGDLFTLKWHHIDFKHRQIQKVIEKTSHSRRKAGKSAINAILPLSDEALSVLRQCHKQWGDADYVFPSPVSGGQLTDVKKAFNAVLQAAKIKDFRFHDLRHTFASRLVSAGVDLNTVRELMTHSDIKMTLVYAHLSPDHKADALNRAFGGGV
jgi:integrase